MNDEFSEQQTVIVPRDKLAVHKTSARTGDGDDTWRTPEWLLERVRSVGGRITCDPATAPSNPTNAQIFYTPELDGLSHPWVGPNVFCNPPYSELRKWADALDRNLNGPDAPLHCFMLTPARTDTQAFGTLVKNNPLVLFLRGRLKFGTSNNPAPFPSALFYFGRSAEGQAKFRAVFGELGVIGRFD